MAGRNWGGAAGETDTYYGLAEVRIYRHGAPAAAGAFIAGRSPGASSFAGDAYPDNTTSNFGMSDATTGAFGRTATIGNNTSKWITAPHDAAPYILYDLGGTYPVGDMAIWNLNVSAFGVDLTAHGIRQAEIWHHISNPYNVFDTPGNNMAGGGWKKLTTVTLARATGSTAQARAALVSFGGARARYVAVIPTGGVGVGNHGGDAYGLGQVRFYAATELVAEPALQWQSLFGQRSINPSRIQGGYEHGGVLFLGALRVEKVGSALVNRSFDIVRVFLDASGSPDYGQANLASNQFVTPFARFPSDPAGTIGFPCQLVKFGADVYVYGWKGNDADTKLVVGRFAPADFNNFGPTSSWRFHDGTWNNQDVCIQVRRPVHQDMHAASRT